jgi:hypothetical protein
MQINLEPQQLLSSSVVRLGVCGMLCVNKRRRGPESSGLSAAERAPRENWFSQSAERQPGNARANDPARERISIMLRAYV